MLWWQFILSQNMLQKTFLCRVLCRSSLPNLPTEVICRRFEWNSFANYCSRRLLPIVFAADDRWRFCRPLVLKSFADILYWNRLLQYSAAIFDEVSCRTSLPKAFVEDFCWSLLPKAMQRFPAEIVPQSYLSKIIILPFLRNSSAEDICRRLLPKSPVEDFAEILCRNSLPKTSPKLLPKA